MWQRGISIQWQKIISFEKGKWTTAMHQRENEITSLPHTVYKKPKPTKKQVLEYV